MDKVNASKDLIARARKLEIEGCGGYSCGSNFVEAEDLIAELADEVERLQALLGKRDGD